MGRLGCGCGVGITRQVSAALPANLLTDTWVDFNAVSSLAAGVLRLDYDGSHAYGGAFQVVMTVGKTYRLTGDIAGDGTAAPAVTDGVAVIKSGTASATWQAVDETFVAAGTILLLCSYNFDTGLYVRGRNLYLYEVV